MIAWSIHSGADQLWIATTTGGYTRLTSLHSGKVLDVPGASTTDGTQFVRWAHNNGNNQQWTLQSTGDGYYRLVSRSSGKAADPASTANGAAVVQQPIGTATTQQWQLVRV